MTIALVIPTQGRPYPAYPKGLEDMQALVGGLIEPVGLSLPGGLHGPDCLAEMYVNEEGLLARLPYNPLATWLAAYGRAGLPADNLILGQVFVVGPVDEEGNDTDVPEQVVQDVVLHREMIARWGQIVQESEEDDD